MAWNADAGVLWVASVDGDHSIYGLTPDDGWEQAAVISHPEPGGGGGIAMKDDGNLWVLSRLTGTVFLVESGIPYVGARWLRAAPGAGTVDPESSEVIGVYADSTGLEAGTYNGEIGIATNGGREDLLTGPVTTHVVDPAAPELTIAEPEDETHTNAAFITVAGTAADPAGGAVMVTVNGEEVPVDDDGGFSFAELLPEDDGEHVINVTAVNGAGLETTEIRTVIVDRTDPVIDEDSIQPAEDVVLEWDEQLEIGFTSESGLTVAYQLMLNGIAAGAGSYAGDEPNGTDAGEGIFVRGIPFEEDADEPGTYKVVYTAPEASFSGAQIQINAMDPAGNKVHIMAPGRVTVVAAAEPVGPPELIITEPEDGLLTNRGAVRISGTATDDQPGQSIEEVTVNGRRVAVDDDGSFTTRIALVEGANVITVRALNTAGETAAETVTVTADWTPPELASMEPAEEVILTAGESYTVRFTSEPGLTAAFQVLIGGQRGEWHGKDIPVRGAAMVEVEDGVYEGTYTAPADTAFTEAIVQFNAADTAGNVTMVTAPGSITVARD